MEDVLSFTTKKKLTFKLLIMNKNEFDEFAKIVSIKIGDEDLTDYFIPTGKVINPKVAKEEYNRITDILLTK
jgi:hypothetical protein